MSSPQRGATAEAIATAIASAEAIADKKGEDIVILDLSSLLVVVDVFVLASGTSTRHVKSLVDDAEKALRRLDRKPIRREGRDHGEWVLLDYGDVVVHIFDRETRTYYQLERLWADAPRIAFTPVSPAAVE
ncbi:MAG: ribosome silencing factor [Acidimicrobiia bacterium]|nr:MAG: ribosome silencing factor [Acidimicrobiia bacterium]